MYARAYICSCPREGLARLVVASGQLHACVIACGVAKRRLNALSSLEARPLCRVTDRCNALLVPRTHAATRTELRLRLPVQRVTVVAFGAACQTMYAHLMLVEHVCWECFKWSIRRDQSSIASYPYISQFTSCLLVAVHIGSDCVSVQSNSCSLSTSACRRLRRNARSKLLLGSLIILRKSSKPRFDW